MIIRSKAPLRLGLAGGGTDIIPYCDKYGGVVLNATINMYAYCTIMPSNNKKIKFEAIDIKKRIECSSENKLTSNGVLDLHIAIYNRIVKEFNNDVPLSFSMTTYSDAPVGSGLGSSSTMVVAIIKAFVEWLHLPLGEYDIGHLAYEIERNDIGLSGGKQDQYAATFGGFNFMEFYEKDRVIVNPLRIKNWIIDELESSMILFYTGTSRDSARIIDEQRENVIKNKKESVFAMHEVKKDAYRMKEAVLKGDISNFASTLGKSWNAKKKMADSISNNHIDEIYSIAIKNGAYSGKVSGAGGGGFMMFVVDPIKRIKVINALNKYECGKVMNFHFVTEGTKGWRII